MSDIILLDNNTIDKIAAGEVVENPASIVKELIENSMDSGANRISVEIKNGGIEYIRVTDNGSGISKANIRKAFLRHATSKISSIEDLFVIKTMGFRGEALASIASVSKVELISKEKDSLMGTRYLIEGGSEKSIDEIGAPDGTSIIVRNLFYNTPARRKFLKSESTEAGYISDILQNLSLCRPDISFSFIVNGKHKLSSSGNNNLKEVIYRLYGKELISEIIPIDYEKDGISVKGYLGEPSQNRSSRNYETYFINNRLVKSKVISDGIEAAYKAYTMQHKFPFCVLHFSIDTHEIDVNVHPSKKEVRFQNKDFIIDFVSSSISCTLHNNEMIAALKLDETKEKAPEYTNNPEPFENIRISQLSADDTKVITNINNTDNTKNTDNTSNTYDINNTSNTNDTNNTNTNDTIDSDKSYIQDIFVDEEYDSEKFIKPTEINIGYDDSKANTSLKNDNNINNSETDVINENYKIVKESFQTLKSNFKVSDNPDSFKNIIVDNPVQMNLLDDERFLSENSVKDYEIIGQIFNSYWIIAFKDKIYFIDQHAAHEKVNYERLMKRVRDNEVVSQYLNPAVVISLSPKDKNILEDNYEYFTKIGFEIDEIGFNEIGLRATPLELYFNNPKDFFTEILTELEKYSIKDSADVICSRIATMACKASVKAGMKMNMQEIKVLIDELLTLENPYHCPHGRPTIFSISKYELEKKFKRIVD